MRAYNVHPERISAWYPELLAYAQQGGVVIVQYNTMPGPKPNELPHPLQVSHDRVTDENAAVRILAPEHPVMNFPNKITAQDFAGWVQERGLYFPDQWDAAWTPILSSNDPGEPPRDGGLLVTRCAKGLVHLHRLFLVPRIARRRPRRLSHLRQHDFVRQSAQMKTYPLSRRHPGQGGGTTSVSSLLESRTGRSPSLQGAVAGGDAA